MSQSFLPVRLPDGKEVGAIWFNNTSDIGRSHLYDNADQACDHFLGHLRIEPPRGGYERTKLCEELRHIPIAAEIVNGDKVWQATVCLDCRIVHDGLDPYNQANGQ